MSFPEAQKKSKKSEKDDQDKEQDKGKDKQKDRKQKETLSLQLSHKSKPMRAYKTSNSKSTVKQLNHMISLSDNDKGRDMAFGKNDKKLLAPKTEEKKDFLIQKRLDEQGRIYGKDRIDSRGRQKKKQPRHSCVDNENENSAEREEKLSRDRDKTNNKRQRSKSSERENQGNVQGKEKGAPNKKKFWQCWKRPKDDYVEPDPQTIETKSWKLSDVEQENDGSDKGKTKSTNQDTKRVTIKPDPKTVQTKKWKYSDVLLEVLPEDVAGNVRLTRQMEYERTTQRKRQWPYSTCAEERLPPPDHNPPESETS